MYGASQGCPSWRRRANITYVSGSTLPSSLAREDKYPRFNASSDTKPMRVKGGECGAAPEFKGKGTGYPRENPPTNGIVWHYSVPTRKNLEVAHPGVEPGHMTSIQGPIGAQLASPCTRKIGPALSPHFVQDVPCMRTCAGNSRARSASRASLALILHRGVGVSLVEAHGGEAVREICSQLCWVCVAGCVGVSLVEAHCGEAVREICSELCWVCVAGCVGVSLVETHGGEAVREICSELCWVCVAGCVSVSLVEAHGGEAVREICSELCWVCVAGGVGVSLVEAHGGEAAREICSELCWVRVAGCVSVSLVEAHGGEAVREICSELCWVLLQDVSEVSVFLFEKRTAEKLHKPKRKETVTEILRGSVRQLERFRHPKVLQTSEHAIVKTKSHHKHTTISSPTNQHCIAKTPPSHYNQHTSTALPTHHIVTILPLSPPHHHYLLHINIISTAPQSSLPHYHRHHTTIIATTPPLSPPHHHYLLHINIISTAPQSSLPHYHRHHTTIIATTPQLSPPYQHHIDCTTNVSTTLPSPPQHHNLHRRCFYRHATITSPTSHHHTTITEPTSLYHYPSNTIKITVNQNYQHTTNMLSPPLPLSAKMFPAVLHPVEECGETLAFASEPVLASLMNVLAFQEGSAQSGVPPATGASQQGHQPTHHRPAHAREYHFLDIELKYGILQVSQPPRPTPANLVRHDGKTVRLAHRSDEALGVRVTVALIAPSLLDFGRGVPTGVHPTL
ncbi:hypothetical protein PR048_033680 [Dryococelus australis]|uniref:Uncharacterized protein n=1 Tax=Dryococelus australis TaxID=614101 RepID=A0ABQ9G3S9_9NEOP|nr:hypothetical protein PR048_033680 [Dryococelus australis]